MEFFTVIAPTYEEAVSKARKKYGDRLRIHSRKELCKSGAFGFGKTSLCELTCYLTEPVIIDESKFEEPKEELKAETSDTHESPDESQNNIKEDTSEPEPESLSVEGPVFGNTVFDYHISLATKLLRKNDFSDSCIDYCIEQLKERLFSVTATLSEKDFELILLDIIAGSFEIDHQIQNQPKRICALLGLTGSGKTTTLAKLAAMFSRSQTDNKRNVRIISLYDEGPAVHQLENLGKALSIEVSSAMHESELSDVLIPKLGNELVLVDTCGKLLNNNEPDYRLYGLLNVTEQNSTQFLLVVPATLKNSDIACMFEQYKMFDIDGIIVTKIDETSTIGNIISASKDYNLPLIFATDGKRIPKDFKVVTMNMLLKLLKDFTVDLSSIFEEEKF